LDVTITTVTPAAPPPTHQIRAVYNATTITVYQAFPPEIALPALANGRFVAPFKVDRMTWIKPSFRWMMYRCGWATKPGQEHVLAVEITRTGFEWALEHSCLSHFDRNRHQSRDAWAEQLRASPVRVQWDPERSLRLDPLPHRSLQVGLSGSAVHLYMNDWIETINDCTGTARAMHDLLRGGDVAAARTLLPDERPYPLPAHIAARVGASTPQDSG
jgi:hypothetical protein